MKGNKEDFYSLISKALRLEAKYEKQNERYNHILDISNRYSKGDKLEITMAKSECEATKEKLDELVEKISKFELNPKTQEYYNLYILKSELIRRFWKVKTEIGYISSTFVFACMHNEEVDLNLSDKRESLKKQNEITDREIKELTLKMKTIHSV